MSNSNDHPHVPFDPSLLSTPARRRYRPSSPYDIDDGLESQFNFTPSRPVTLLDIDVRNGVRSYPQSTTATMFGATAAAGATGVAEMTLEEKLVHLTKLAEMQQKQMEEANAFASRQAEQLQASQQQLIESQQTVQRLSNAFESLSTQPRPHPQQASAPKKKPELPPFDSKNVIIWIRRIEAAYARVGVIEAKDKFAWLESLFQVKLNPRIDAFLYGSNTEADWTEFIQYLKDEYGPTKRQRAQKLLAENPRHDMKPSQFLIQLEEDTKDVEIDDVRKEHLLKTLPPRIREFMGKEVEKKSSKEIAAWADQFFDRQGRPLERTTTTINNVSSSSSTATEAAAAASSPASSFTSAFNDDNTDVNFVKRGGFSGRGRPNNRGNRSNSRPRFNSFSNSSSAASRPSGDSSAQQQQQHPPGTCRFHRKFGNQANKCVSDCPKFKSFAAQQSKQQGNGNGGRRM